MLTACKKDNPTAVPFSAVIEMITPNSGTVVNGGNSFPVQATITSNREMHGYHIIVYNGSDESVVYENQYHEHGTTFNVNETVPHSLTSAAPLRLIIEATGDHEGDRASKTTEFSYQP